MLFFNLIIYEQKIKLLPLIASFFYKNRTKSIVDLNHIEVKSSKKVVHSGTLDVIIPTIGRKAYLYDVLHDLKKQTILPKNVIIIEQNPSPDSLSELEYLTTESWPFAIKHTFTHQAGACNARNLALSQVTNEWVFLADDDIRFEDHFFEKSLEQLEIFGAKAVSLRCFQENQKLTFFNVFQWVGFGSGCSLVLANSLKECEFKMGFEFGFGEDSDFGMQLRNLGNDVLYFPNPEILHLKAPVGGFRTKPVLAWQQDAVQPKPSPTVMLNQIRHQTKEQILGYKTNLCIKFYKNQKIKNPIKYYHNFQKQWNKSVYWADELSKK